MWKGALTGVLFAGLLSGNALAALVANPPTVDNLLNLDASWSWALEAGGGPVPIRSRNWMAVLDLSRQGNLWEGKLRAQHLRHPHGEMNAPLFAYDFRFPVARIGAGLGIVGSFSASALHPGMGHEDSVAFVLNRAPNPMNTEIKIELRHPPIPLPPSILFLGSGFAGLLALAYRRRTSALA